MLVTHLLSRVAVFLQEEGDLAKLPRARVVKLSFRGDLLGVGGVADELDVPPGLRVADGDSR